MHLPANPQLTASPNLIAQLFGDFKRRCVTDLKQSCVSKCNEPVTPDQLLEILDELIPTSGIQHLELVDALVQEVSLHPSPELVCMAEAIAQWFCTRHGLEGEVEAHFLRRPLADLQLANPVMLFNLSQQELNWGGGASKVSVAHEMNELVLRRETEPSSLRILALIQSAKCFADGVTGTSKLDLARARLLEATRLGSLDGAFYLGLLHDGRFHLGTSPYIDRELASCFYAIAQRGGHLAAQTNLSLLHIKKTILNPDPEFGWELLRDASQRGDRIAQDCITKLSFSDM